MARIVVELTNRCNLRCQHCFSGRHGGRDDLPLDIVRHILAEGKENGFDQVNYTGGDPTVHPYFGEVIGLTFEAGYTSGFNTNGWNFQKIYTQLLPYRAQLQVITFSMDGATETTHDRLRGKGSYRRLMQAMSICVMEDIPFTINMVVTTHNRHEIGQMAKIAANLGSRGLRFGHLMPSPITTQQNFDLSPWERKQVEAEIWHLRNQHPIRIAMGPGYHTTNLFPCTALNLQEINIDCQGNLTKCCHLSGHGDGVGQADIMGNLGHTAFSEAYQRLRQENEQFHQTKLERLANNMFQDADFFPCWYCSLYYKKVNWLKAVEDHAWADLIWDLPVNDSSRLSPVASHPIELL